MQSARRLLAHAAILAFMLEAGLNRHRLEFAIADLTKCCDRLADQLKLAGATDRVCGWCTAPCAQAAGAIHPVGCVLPPWFVVFARACCTTTSNHR